MEIKAVFIGYQEGIDDINPYPLFNIYWPGHDKNESTVDANYLVYIGIPVPISPSYKEWKNHGSK